MKKQITLFLLIFLTTMGLSAETGYNGIEWFTDTEEIELGWETEIPHTSEVELKDFIRMQEKPMLGEMTQVFYYFYEGSLIGIAYSIDARQTPRLLEKFSNLVFQTNSSIISKESITNPNITEENENMYYSMSFFYVAASSQGEGYAQYASPTGTAKFFIYDYNNDTRVYIFQNILQGRTFVVYLPYEQDY